MTLPRLNVTSALLIGTLALSACGSWSGSRLNPTNWFDRDSTEAPVPENFNPLLPIEEDRISLASAPDEEEEIDARSEPITRITGLRIDRTATGAIVVATGEAKRLGAFAAHLVPEETSDVPGASRELTYVFRVTYPKSPSYRGTEATRSIRAAVSLSDRDLAAVRTIRVVGAENAREIRR